MRTHTGPFHYHSIVPGGKSFVSHSHMCQTPAPEIGMGHCYRATEQRPGIDRGLSRGGSGLSIPSRPPSRSALSPYTATPYLVRGGPSALTPPHHRPAGGQPDLCMRHGTGQRRAVLMRAHECRGPWVPQRDGEARGQGGVVCSMPRLRGHWTGVLGPRGGHRRWV